MSTVSSTGGSFPGCTDKLLSVIANEAMHEAHQEKTERGTIWGRVLCLLPDGEGKDDAIKNYVEAAHSETRKINKEGMEKWDLHEH